MEIIIGKNIDIDGACKLEIVSNDYNQSKPVIDLIVDVASKIITGKYEDASTLKIQKETITQLLWDSTQKCAESNRKRRELEEKIQSDDMLISHYDNDLRRAEKLLKDCMPYISNIPLLANVQEFLNRERTVCNDDTNAI